MIAVENGNRPTTSAHNYSVWAVDIIHRTTEWSDFDVQSGIFQEQKHSSINVKQQEQE
jgi:hypothetical protein